MFLVMGRMTPTIVVSADYNLPLCNLSNMLRGAVLNSAPDVLEFFRQVYKEDVTRMSLTFREWMSTQTGYMVFFLSVGNHPRLFDWNEIKALVKETEKRRE